MTGVAPVAELAFSSTIEFSSPTKVYMLKWLSWNISLITTTTKLWLEKKGGKSF